MKVLELFKNQPPFAEVSQSLRKEIQAGSISEDDDAGPVIERFFDSLDKVEFMMFLDELGWVVSTRMTIRELLWVLERLEAEYRKKRGG